MLNVEQLKLVILLKLLVLRDTKTTTVTGFEMFQKTLDESVAGDNVGILFVVFKKLILKVEWYLAKPGTITPHTKFEAQVYVLTKEEGGRHTPFFPGYRPQFYVRTTDVTGKIESFRADDDSATQMVMPGDRIKMIVELFNQLQLKKECDLLFVKVVEQLVLVL